MAEDTSPSPDGRRWPWGRIALFLSLGLNLLIVGVVAGAMLGGGARDRMPDRRPQLADLGFGPYVEALTPGDRAALVAGLRREAGAFRENRAALRSQFEAILVALRAEPFDAEALSGIITDQQGKLFERQALGRELVLERIAGMSAEDRAAYADRLERLLRRAPRPAEAPPRP